MKKTFETNIGEGLSSIIATLTKKNESNLIYSSKGNFAEKWALKYSNSIEIETKLEDELIDLIRFIKAELHPKYYLITCLEKRIAFHHSSLSEFIRKEIESLFELGVIKTLFCTSTLLEGVNLPADNLFIIKPEKNTTLLTDFEFGNLIGRAGRLKNSLYGTIICLSKKNNTKWAEDYFNASYKKEIKTASSRGLPFIQLEDLIKNSNEIESSKAKNLITLLRNKALKKDGSLERFLNKNKLDHDKLDTISKQVHKSIEPLTIPYTVVKQNPTIDPILQDKLYKRIIDDGIDNWVIHSNSNFNSGYKREVAESINYKEKNFFWQLDSIIVRLNDIFDLSKEIWKKDNISLTPTAICINAINWIQGRSIGELIHSRIKYYSEDERVKPDKRIDPNNEQHINKAIKTVIKINLKVITFSLLKYFKLLVDILDCVLTEDQKEKFKLTLALPIHLELGTQEPIIIFLISSGVPRTISIKINQIFRKTNEFKNEINVLDWMKTQYQIEGLDPIYNKFLRKNNLLKSK